MTETASAKRSTPYQVVFAKEIAELIIKPRLQQLLTGGVTSKSDLANRFSEAYGCSMGNDTLDRFLSLMGPPYSTLFDKPIFRLDDPISVARAAGVVIPQQPAIPGLDDVLAGASEDLAKKIMAEAAPGTITPVQAMAMAGFDTPPPSPPVDPDLPPPGNTVIAPFMG